MTRNPDGHVSLLVQFPPPEARAAARRLAALLAGETRMTFDPQRGNLELSHVRGHDLRPLTDWLYRRGARSVFVRYQHEGLEPDNSARAAGAALLH
jgi:hypothetical protein